MRFKKVQGGLRRFRKVQWIPKVSKDSKGSKGSKDHMMVMVALLDQVLAMLEESDGHAAVIAAPIDWSQRTCSVLTQICKSVTRSLIFYPRGPQRGNSIEFVEILF